MKSFVGPYHSIHFAGHYELLVVGEYSIFRVIHGQVQISEDTSTRIRVPAHASESITTRRLAYQYIKRHSHQPWDFHCARFFSKGFYPISPVELMDHVSQKFRKFNNHHFNSAVLLLISSSNAIKPDDLEALWSLLIRLPFYKAKMEAASKTSTNFAEMSDVLKMLKDDSHIGSLIHILGHLQTKTPCFFLSLYDETVAKDIALKIMTSGFKKKEIHAQHGAIINKFKKDITFFYK